MVREILSKNLFYAKLLCHVKDTKGRDIFGIVDSAVRVVMEEYIYFCGRYDLSDGPPVRSFCHNFTQTCHNFTRSCHTLTRTCHNLTRTCHNFTRTCHHLTRNCHNLTRTFPQVHRSATAVVIYADDHNRKKQKQLSNSSADQLTEIRTPIEKVVIKFMLNQQQYFREKFVRQNNKFDEMYVVGMFIMAIYDPFLQYCELKTSITRYSRRPHRA